MKKFIFILATVTLLNSNVFADTNTSVIMDNDEYTEISPKYIAIITPYKNLSISDGKATCYGYTKTQDNYKAKVKVELQKLNSTWTTIKSWEKTSTSSSATIDKTYSVTKGYSYRLKTTHYALNSSGSVVDSVVKYSSTVSY
ncbi:MAG: hypothetical protein Q4D26_04345 [Clostridia bacterium]|nr:hypothetical protein [Clostridia bacterium]